MIFEDEIRFEWGVTEGGKHEGEDTGMPPSAEKRSNDAGEQSRGE